MDHWFVSIHIGILFALFYLLYLLQKRHVSFSKRVFAGLGMGIILGALLQLFYGNDSPITSKTIEWFNIAGTGYVRLLQMIVMPLVFISILGAFTQLKMTKNLGKISFLVIGILLGTTAISAGIGIGSSYLFHLDELELVKGDAENARNEELVERAGMVENLSIPEQVLSFIPTNPFNDLTGSRPTSTIAVVIFATFMGVAYLGIRNKQPEQAEVFAKLIGSLYAIVMRIVKLILRLTPYGILALMAKMVATSNVEAIIKLGEFVIASYIAIFAMFLVHLFLLSLAKLNPITYLKKAMPTLIFAFTSRSSAGTLPLTIKTLTERLGVSEGVANFSGTFSLSIGQNGCAGIYPAMLAVMAAPMAGINPMEPGFILSLILVVMVSSFGVAGVGGGATFASLIVLSMLNLPIAIVGLLITIEPLIDMGRTALNVSGGMTAGALTGRLTGELDTDIYNHLDETETSFS